MALESGKKYGYTASMIYVIAPISAVALIVCLFVSMFTAYPASVSLFVVGIFQGAMIVIAALSVIALILFFLAMYRLSHYYSEQSIFKNVLYGFLIAIISGVIAVIIEFAFIASLSGQIPALGVTTPSTGAVGALVAQMMIGFAAIFVIAFISSILSAVLYWRAFTKLGEKSNVESFKTAGLLYLIGSVLAIVIIGYVLIWIAWIFAAKGYRQLKPQTSTTTPSYPSTYPPSNPNKIYCSYCGTENESNAIYCKNCGKPLHVKQASV